MNSAEPAKSWAKTQAKAPPAAGTSHSTMYQTTSRRMAMRPTAGSSTASPTIMASTGAGSRNTMPETANVKKTA